MVTEALSPYAPRVLRGAAAGWPTRGWSPEALIDRAGGQEITLTVSATGRLALADGAAAAPSRTRATLRGAAATIAGEVPGGPRHYVMQEPLAHSLPELLADLRCEDLPFAVDGRGAHLWFGGPDLVTPLHYDPVHNFYVQAFGRKQVLLAAPDAVDGLYPLGFDTATPHLSRVDPMRPDRERFPAITGVTFIDVELGPGDILYLPAFWWHQFRSCTTAISVSLWHAPDLAACLHATGWRLLRAVHAAGGLADLGAPLADHPGGLLGAAGESLAHGQPRFAALFAAAALRAGRARGPAAALAALEHDLDLPGSPDTDALHLLLAELTPA